MVYNCSNQMLKWRGIGLRRRLIVIDRLFRYRFKVFLRAPCAGTCNLNKKKAPMLPPGPSSLLTAAGAGPLSDLRGNSTGGHPGRGIPRHHTMRHWITSFQLLTERRLASAPPPSQENSRVRISRTLRRPDCCLKSAGRCCRPGPDRSGWLPLARVCAVAADSAA